MKTWTIARYKTVKYETFLKTHLELIETKLRQELLRREALPVIIHKAMQYAVFTGGKRFRPVLALSACEACGGKSKDALPAALTIELIHTYSLVHDDLPALDDDDTRRGKPTCHRKFGEANAILAGDGLLTLAFELLADIRPAERGIRILREISTAAGVHGMIGGQVADLMGSSQKSQKELDFICKNKTGQLIRASVLAGALSAGASERKLQQFGRYGECLGLAFQVVDDILDQDGYCRVLSPGEAIQKAKKLMAKAKNAVSGFGSKAGKLIFLADFLESRIPQSKSGPR